MVTSKHVTTFERPSDLEIVMTHTFDAPRALVFEAYTKPEHIPHWWGPAKYTTTVDTMDMRVGGNWRYVSRDADGSEFAFHGECLELVPPERIVTTFEWEGLPGHVSIDTVTSTSRFASPEDCEGMWQSGMAGGASESMSRLADYLTTMS